MSWTCKSMAGTMWRLGEEHWCISPIAQFTSCSVDHSTQQRLHEASDHWPCAILGVSTWDAASVGWSIGWLSSLFYIASGFGRRPAIGFSPCTACWASRLKLWSRLLSLGVTSVRGGRPFGFLLARHVGPAG